MIELTQEQIELVSGGLQWDSNTCGATWTIGLTLGGAAIGGLVGAGVGGFAGDWIGDNFCPSPTLR